MLQTQRNRLFLLGLSPLCVSCSNDPEDPFGTFGDGGRPIFGSDDASGGGSEEAESSSGAVSAEGTGTDGGASTSAIDTSTSSTAGEDSGTIAPLDDTGGSPGDTSTSTTASDATFTTTSTTTTAANTSDSGEVPSDSAEYYCPLIAGVFFYCAPNPVLAAIYSYEAYYDCVDNFALASGIGAACVNAVEDLYVCLILAPCGSLLAGTACAAQLANANTICFP